MEITTPGLNLVLPGPRKRRLLNRRSVAQFAAAVLVLFGLIAVFASERAGGPSHPQPTMEANLGVYPPSLATPSSTELNGVERELGVLWKIPNESPDTSLADIGIFAGVTYFLEQDEVVAVDSTTGAVKWRTNVGRGWGLLADASGVYVTASASSDDPASTLIKLDWQHGEQVWSTPVGLYAGKPLLSQEVIYVWDTANTLYAVGAGSGVELWHRDYSLSPMSQEDIQSYVDAVGRLPVAVLAGDSLIVGTSDARVGRIDLTLGGDRDWLWTAQFDSARPIGFEIATAGNTVAATSYATNDGQILETSLVAWEIDTGGEIWRGDASSDYFWLISTGTAFAVSKTPHPNVATPNPQNPAFALEPNYATVALDPQSGDQLWSAKATLPVALSPDRSLVIAETSNGWTAAIDAKTGAVLGSIYPAGFLSNRLVSDSSAIYTLRSDGSLVAVKISALMNGNLDGAPIATPEATASAESDFALLWQSEPVQNVNYVGPATVSNGTIFRLVFSEAFEGIEAIDTETGATRWRYATEATDLVADDRGVYVTVATYDLSQAPSAASTPETSRGASVVALDPETGDRLWSTDTGNYEAHPVLRDGVLYLIEQVGPSNIGRGMTQEATAIDTANGSIIWSRTVSAPSGYESWTTDLALPPNRLVAGESVLVALLGNGSLVGLDRTNGETLWEHDDFDPLNFTVDLRVSGSTVLAAVYGRGNLGKSLEGFSGLQSKSAVIAYNIDDGTPLWGYDTGNMPSNLAVSDGLAVVRVNPKHTSEATPQSSGMEIDWAIVGIDVATGTLKWQGMSGSGDPDDLSTSVVQATDSNTIYAINSSLNSLMVVDPATGLTALGRSNYDQPIEGAALSDGEHVYVQLADGSIAASAMPVAPMPVSPDQLELPTTEPGDSSTDPEETASDLDVALWTAPPESGEFEGSSVVFAGNVVIRAIKTSGFYGIEGLNALSGEQLWSREMEWTGAPVSDGHVVFVPANSAESNVGEVIAIDPLTGTTRWDTTFGGQVSTPNLQLDDGIYVMSSNDMVTKLDPISGDKEWESVMDSSGYTPALFPDLRAPAVAANAVVTISNSGTMFAFDRYAGGKIWSKSGYDATTTRYAANGDVLVITRGPDSTATPEATTGETLPMRIERIDLTTGETAWSLSALFPLPNQPIISSGYYNDQGYVSFINVLVEQASTADGYYDENGFHPGEAPTVTSPVGQTTGTLIIIDPDSGSVESLQFDQQFAYGTLGVGSFSDLLSWPVRTPTNNGPRIDLGQPIYGPPATDNQIFLVTLQDGTLVALDASVTRLG